MLLFLYDDTQLCSKTCDDYHDKLDGEGGHLPISAFNTAHMTELASATKDILHSIYDTKTAINTDGLIYYYAYSMSSADEHVMYDMNDFLLRHASQEYYKNWQEKLKLATAYKRMSTRWQVMGTLDFDFEVTEERFSGISMFVPLTRYDNTLLKYNEGIKKTAWYQAVGWSELGW